MITTGIDSGKALWYCILGFDYPKVLEDLCGQSRTEALLKIFAREIARAFCEDSWA
jgi:hypothetical protein